MKRRGNGKSELAHALWRVEYFFTTVLIWAFGDFCDLDGSKAEERERQEHQRQEDQQQEKGRQAGEPVEGGPEGDAAPPAKAKIFGFRQAPGRHMDEAAPGRHTDEAAPGRHTDEAAPPPSKPPDLSTFKKN